ncbi:DNA adenine methylase [Pseudomonas umsongensis]|uniref:DNA adenine methylase n=1 Tax=Pseudomonas umsongensis TaxID=198618 RepID=UPI00039FF06A|nr:DNA adenine methylase [Pseudomonas umsongensis]
MSKLDASAQFPLVKVVGEGNTKASKWFSKSVLAKIECLDSFVYSSAQFDRVEMLGRQAELRPYINPHPSSLFPSTEELLLGEGTVISDGLAESEVNAEGEEILLQLLPYWIESEQRSDLGSKLTNAWGQELLGSYDINSRFPSLLERIRTAKNRTSSLLNSRATQFSRSAHYMGSKAFFAPYLSEIMHTLLSPDTVVIDLMCGSGAASGYFSHEWRTLASDAQEFSRLLAKVQGGGFDGERALKIADEVLVSARSHYESLPEYIKENIDVESDFLASELSPLVKGGLYKWISEYSRINNAKIQTEQVFYDLVAERQADNGTAPYLLFSAYYANLFFGVRQSAEIDSLRYAIDQLANKEDRSWALGALLCATSSCAYSYGGHFAQPKYDGVDEARLNLLASDLVVCRGLSVSHEFFVRLTSLGEESSKTRYGVESISGPWEIAVKEAENILIGKSVCVYLDPPYTRDEYSRYYHILETLVRYDYPKVQDKASMPKRGDAGRFASAFATRNTGLIEDLIVKIIEVSLSKGWSCLWSYSSVGVASVENILDRISIGGRKVDVFGMDHSYKGQGKHKAKAVREYAILIQN